MRALALISRTRAAGHVLMAMEAIAGREVSSTHYVKDALLLILWHVLKVVFLVVRMGLHWITFMASYLGSFVTCLLSKFYCEEQSSFSQWPLVIRSVTWPWDRVCPFLSKSFSPVRGYQKVETMSFICCRPHGVQCSFTSTLVDVCYFLISLFINRYLLVYLLIDIDDLSCSNPNFIKYQTSSINWVRARAR